MQHNRLFWFLVFGGLWIIGLLCVRRYGKGLLAQFYIIQGKFIFLIGCINDQ